MSATPAASPAASPATSPAQRLIDSPMGSHKLQLPEGTGNMHYADTADNEQGAAGL